MWSQMETVSDELRPDKCGILFDRISDTVIAARLEDDKKLNGLLSAQVDYFNQEGFSVVIFRGREKKIFLNDHQTETDVIEILHDRA